MPEPSMVQLRTAADVGHLLALLPDDCQVTVTRSPLMVVVKRGIRSVVIGPGDWLIRHDGRVMRAAVPTAAVPASPRSCPTRHGVAVDTASRPQPPAS